MDTLEYEQGRNEKQAYLIQHIVEAGYDANLFAQFLNSRIEDGVNIDNWSFEGLKQAVNDFLQMQGQ